MAFQLVSCLKNIKTNWNNVLFNIYNNDKTIKKKLDETEEFINHKLQIYNGKINIFPPFPLFFNAFNYFNFEDTKIVIMGQDPYHQPGQAMGLSFSVFDDVKQPPSLQNIFKELNKDVENFAIPTTGNLTKWAEQGVLLLNSSLSVLQSSPNSHRTKWEFFTDAIITYIASNNKNIVFMLWGNFAKKKKKLITNPDNHLILEASHPSPLSANKGGWFGCKHFTKANSYLIEKGKESVNWTI